MGVKEAVGATTEKCVAEQPRWLVAALQVRLVRRKRVAGKGAVCSGNRFYAEQWSGRAAEGEAIAQEEDRGRGRTREQQNWSGL